jgi:hypothetical protein
MAKAIRPLAVMAFEGPAERIGTSKVQISRHMLQRMAPLEQAGSLFHTFPTQPELG